MTITPSKETLEAVAEAIERVALTLPKASGRETTLLFAQSSFTAVMQSKEVRELVDAAQNVAGFCRKLDLLRPDEKRLSEALRPFTPTNEAEDE